MVDMQKELNLLKAKVQQLESDKLNSDGNKSMKLDYKHKTCRVKGYVRCIYSLTLSECYLMTRKVLVRQMKEAVG